MDNEWYYSLSSGSAGTIRKAALRNWRVEYNEKGEVTWNNLPTGWRIPVWPGDDHVKQTSYSFGFNV